MIIDIPERYISYRAYIDRIEVTVDPFPDTVLAVTGDGFTYAQLEDYADVMKKELSLVQGVARVELWGVQDKVIYLEASERQLSERGITAQNFVSTLRAQNMVLDAGYVDAQQERLRVAPTGRFDSPEEIGVAL